MVYEQARTKLMEMKLEGMATALEEQMASTLFSDLSFEERILHLVDNEQTWRENKRLNRLLNQARLREKGCLADGIYGASRGVEKSTILSLSSCEWIRRGQNMLITGPTGTGKTWLACGFGNQACRKGLSTLFCRVPLMLEEIAISHGDGSFINKLNKMKKMDLLILDDFGLTQLDIQARRDLLEIVESRSGFKSTIVTTQLPIDKWHDFLSKGNSTVADAIMDRLIGNAHRIELKGESLRKSGPS